MADNAYLAVYAVVVWVFLTLHAQTAECEKKVCLGSASVCSVQRSGALILLAGATSAKQD